MLFFESCIQISNFVLISCYYIIEKESKCINIIVFRIFIMVRVSKAKSSRKANISKANERFTTVSNATSNKAKDVSVPTRIPVENSLNKATEALRLKRETMKERRSKQVSQMKLVRSIGIQKSLINEMRSSGSQRNKPPKSKPWKQFDQLSKAGKKYRLKTVKNMVDNNLGTDYSVIRHRNTTPKDGLRLLLTKNISLRKYGAVAKTSSRTRTFFIIIFALI